MYATLKANQMQAPVTAGGGRKVTRVEVSLDKAKTWIISNMIRQDDQREK